MFPSHLRLAPVEMGEGPVAQRNAGASHRFRPQNCDTDATIDVDYNTWELRPWQRENGWATLTDKTRRHRCKHGVH
jgi:hypothetical protein